MSVFKAFQPIIFTFFSFPLDGASGLRRQVPEDAVDAGHLVRDAVDDVLHHLEAQLGHVGRDGIDGVDL